jgi:hypothetical protein
MEPKEAAALLTQAMTKTTDPNALMRLAQGLSAVAARMESKDAAAVCAQAAAVLTQAMTKTTDPNALTRLAQGLLAILDRNPRQRAAAYAAKVAGAGDPWSLFAAPALLQAPPPLPAQTLVDILKLPFCVGEARRVVLEQLSRHYGRPFADQWDFVDYVQQQNLGLDLTTPRARARMLP